MNSIAPSSGARCFPPGTAWIAAAVLLWTGFLVAPRCAPAATFPPIALEPFASGFSQPVQLTHAGDGTGRIFVVEQAGRIRILDNGAVHPAPFLDIVPKVLSGGEQGLLGLAFPPGYATSGRFYVNYTRSGDGATVVSRFRVGTDPSLADPDSEEILLVIPQPFANHNGGQIAFGPDGFLYIGTGDGGSGGDPEGNGQRTDTLLGKILRIDVESGSPPYGVPPTNPFVGDPSYREEIWALGLRNPWRFSFDRRTGDLYVADVGQGAVEEVNFQAAGSPGGQNYGWNVMEGSTCFGSSTCSTGGLALPVAEYDHGQGCSVTGGFVHRGNAFPALDGIYFYGDFCQGRIWGLRRTAAAWENQQLLQPPIRISAFGEDEAGFLYVLSYGDGSVSRLVEGNSPPSPTRLLSPEDGATGLPQTVTFRWEPSADPNGDPVTYTLLLSTDPSFSDARLIPVAGPVSGGGGGRVPPGSPQAVAGVLLALAAIRSVRALRSPGLALPALLAGFLLAAAVMPGCGGSDGATQASVSHTESGLSPSTAYYWKVSASDGAAGTESEIRSFTTAL